MPVRFDTFAATIVFLGACVVSVAAYRRLVEVEYPKHAVLQVLPVGNHTHFVRHEGRCVGRFDTEFKTAPETTIISKGELHFSFQGRKITAKTFVGTFFNVLDQLVACNATLEVDNGKISVKTLNPSPILLDAEITYNSETFKHHLELPGPVLLRNNGNETYRIDYSSWSGMWSSYNPKLVHDALGGLSVEVVSRDEDSAACRNEAGEDVVDHAIPIDALVEQAHGLLFKMRQTPFIFPGA